MLFSNLLVALALTVLFPLGLMGVLAATEWLERRTLAAEEVVPRRLRRMDGKPPEEVEAMVLEETAQVVAQYWSATGRPASEASAAQAPSNGDQPAPQPADRSGDGHGNGNGGGRHLRRAGPGRAGRHERRR
ncbi:MAG TPA: hypothetical protein VEY96_05795 [Actinomycetes bacterium]|nr:hypothetical protein [Actinomycetes bacterium]